MTKIWFCKFQRINLVNILVHYEKFVSYDGPYGPKKNKDKYIPKRLIREQIANALATQRLPKRENELDKDEMEQYHYMGYAKFGSKNKFFI